MSAVHSVAGRRLQTSVESLTWTLTRSLCDTRSRELSPVLLASAPQPGSRVCLCVSGERAKQSVAVSVMVL